VVTRLVPTLGIALAVAVCAVPTARAAEVLVVRGDRVTPEEDPFLPAVAADPAARGGLATRGGRCLSVPGVGPVGPASALAARRGPTVRAAVERAFARGEITAEELHQIRSDLLGTA
jgi:hypothetical protein